MSFAWHERIVKVLKANEVRLVTYIPDNVLAPLIGAVHADPWFKVICPAREEEAAGIVAGAYMAGLRGIVLMQTSGFATLPNVLASLIVPYRIPLLMLISERGRLGDHQLGQAIVCSAMRPVLQTLGIEHFAIERLEDVEFVADARGAGLERSEWARDESHFETLVDRALRENGPWFIGARIDGASPAGVTERDPARSRQRFMDALSGKG